MNVCVFCGSSFGFNPLYRQAAESLGKLLPSFGMRLIYGGGNVGLMGVVADAVMQNGGEVIGVIPEFLSNREVAHQNLTTLEIVGSMHERKKRMADLSEAFIALPGGWGTLEELAEVLTWRQLGLVAQPVTLLNINNFFDPLLEQLSKMVQEGFVNPKNFEILRIENSPENLVQYLSQHHSK